MDIILYIYIHIIYIYIYVYYLHIYIYILYTLWPQFLPELNSKTGCLEWVLCSVLLTSCKVFSRLRVVQRGQHPVLLGSNVGGIENADYITPRNCQHDLSTALHSGGHSFHDVLICVDAICPVELFGKAPAVFNGACWLDWLFHWFNMFVLIVLL